MNERAHEQQSVVSNVPVYFRKSGFEAWKRILTLSRGATAVFACMSKVQRRFVQEGSDTHDAARNPPCKP